MAIALFKNRRECTVRCRLGSGRGCLTSVERGPTQAVCQEQILDAKDLARRLGDDATCTTSNNTIHVHDT
jgi:hypothetical protein